MRAGKPIVIAIVLLATFVCARAGTTHDASPLTSTAAAKIAQRPGCRLVGGAGGSSPEPGTADGTERSGARASQWNDSWNLGPAACPARWPRDAQAGTRREQRWLDDAECSPLPSG